MFLTKTAEIADVVLPAARLVVRGRRHGHLERAPRAARAQGARPARAGARRTSRSSPTSPRRLGADWGHPTAEQVWNELRGALALARRHELPRASRSSAGSQWPCPDESHPGSPFLHGRLWQDPVEGPRAPFHAVEHDPPVDQLDDGVPDPPDDRPAARLLQHRRPDRRLHVAAAARRDARHRAGGRRAPRRRRRRGRPRRFAARRDRGARRATTRRCARASRS